MTTKLSELLYRSIVVLLVNVLVILPQVGYVHIEQLRGVFVASHIVINLHLVIEL